MELVFLKFNNLFYYSSYEIKNFEIRKVIDGSNYSIIFKNQDESEAITLLLYSKDYYMLINMTTRVIILIDDVIPEENDENYYQFLDFL